MLVQSCRDLPKVVFAIILGVVASVGAFAAEKGTDPYTGSRMQGGPHLDGDAYRALRGGKANDAVKFDLQITDEKGTLALTVHLGADYVIENEKRSVSVYDFRFRRRLEMKQGRGAFSNESLFGIWEMRYAALMDQMFHVAGMAAVGDGKATPKLMRFWVEQNVGVVDPREKMGNLPKAKIQTRVSEGRMLIQADGTTVAVVTPGEIGFPSPDLASTFAAWLTWSMKIHASVAAEISKAPTLPAQIDRIAAEWAVWEPKSSSLHIRNATLNGDSLGVLAGRAAKIPGWEPHFPNELAALMAAAARGQAPNGPVSDEEYAKRITDLVGQRKLFDAAPIALHAGQPYVSCADPKLGGSLCEVVKKVQRKARSDRDAKILFKAVDLNSGRGKHAEGARAFISLRRRKPARPDILEFMILNALIGAKMVMPQAFDAALQREFNSFGPRILPAFEQDPYDPYRYRVFYNYLRAASSGSAAYYEAKIRAYPIVDMARALPGRRMPRIISEITEFETRVAKDSPVLFPVYGRLGQTPAQSGMKP